MAVRRGPVSSTHSGLNPIATAGEISMTRTRTRGAVLLLAATMLSLGASQAHATDRQQLDGNARAALKSLTASTPAARTLAEKARAVLVFPSILKAGFMFGGQTGNGVLLKNGRTTGYYNTMAASYGFQAGVQTFGYALFFMNEKALAYLDESDGWEVGVGPSIVVVDESMGKSLTSTTMSQDVYAFIFSQSGLMAGMGIQGSKITKLDD
jgi:lipid-binding SYLF domain-containing protein